MNWNAEIVGDKVIMHGSTAGIYGDELIGGVGFVELDLNTLNGFSEGINMWYKISSGTGEVKYDGTVNWTLISCN